MSTKHGTIGRFEVTAELGRGSMGIVHRAHDPVMHRDVAIKTVLIPHGLSEERRAEFQERFLREARAAGRLSHPGIVTIYDFNQTPETDQPFIAMEYVEGPTLHELICAEGALNPDWVLSIGETLADALKTAHDAGVVHRDLKPANILVRKLDGVAKISDFGVARINTSDLTNAGTTYGSPSYMAPERLRGERADDRSDLFSLAVILYEALSGERPFEGVDFASTCYAILNDAPVSIREYDPKLTPAFDRFFERALAKEPIQRFQDGTEFRAALHELRDDQARYGSGARTTMLQLPSTEEVKRAASPIATLALAIDRVRETDTSDDASVICGPASMSRSQAEFMPISPPDPGPLTPSVAEAVRTPAPEADVAGKSGCTTTVPVAFDLADETDSAEPNVPIRGIVFGAVTALAVLILLLVSWNILGDPADAPPFAQTPAASASAEPGPAAASADPVAQPDRGTAPAAGAADSTNWIVLEPAGLQLDTRPIDAKPAARLAASPPEAHRPSPKKPPAEPVAVLPQPAPRVETTALVGDAALPSPGAEPSAEASPSPVDTAYLDVRVKSSLKAGSLTILIDGVEQYSTDLETKARRWSRFVKKVSGNAHQTLESTLEIPSGVHTLVVRLTSDGKDRTYEKSVDLNVFAGRTQAVEIVAGRSFGRRLSVRLE